MNSALIIEDHEDSRALISAILEKSSYATIRCCHPAEDLRQAAAKQPDIIIPDTRLPDTDGFAVIRRLRA